MGTKFKYIIARLKKPELFSTAKYKAISMVQKEKIAIDEIAEYFPELSEKDRNEIESQVLQQVQQNRSVGSRPLFTPTILRCIYFACQVSCLKYTVIENICQVI